MKPGCPHLGAPRREYLPLGLVCVLRNPSKSVAGHCPISINYTRYVVSALRDNFGVMQAGSQMDERDDKGVPIRDLSLSHEERDSATSVEVARDDPGTKRVTRKLLRKLDTR